MKKHFLIISAPGQKRFFFYEKNIIDTGDIHLFVSAEESKSDYLVSLDKKHVLVLQKQIALFRIVSPKELIEQLQIRQTIEATLGM